MSTIISSVDVNRVDAEYKMHMVSFNVQQLKSAQHKTTTEMAEYMGILNGSLSNKIRRVSWRLSDVLLAAKYLNVTIDTLTDDSLYKLINGEEAAEELKENIAHELTANTENTPALVAPRYFVEGAPSGARTLDTRIKSPLL